MTREVRIASMGPSELRLVTEGTSVWWEARLKSNGDIVHTSDKLDRERFKRALNEVGLL